MTLRTSFTEYFSVRHPIALAPMGGSAGAALVAASFLEMTFAPSTWMSTRPSVVTEMASMPPAGAQILPSYTIEKLSLGTPAEASGDPQPASSTSSRSIAGVTETLARLLYASSLK